MTYFFLQSFKKLREASTSFWLSALLVVVATTLTNLTQLGSPADASGMFTNSQVGELEGFSKS